MVAIVIKKLFIVKNKNVQYQVKKLNFSVF